jgi:hypothetical protein
MRVMALAHQAVVRTLVEPSGVKISGGASGSSWPIEHHSKVEVADTADLK